MPSPSATTFQRPDLRESFEEFDLMAQAQKFIGLSILPLFDVALATANFSKVPIEAFLQDTDTLRSSGGHYNRDDWEFDQDNYACKEHGAEEIIDDRERNVFAYTLDFERIAALRAMHRVLRAQEIRIATAMQNTATFTNAAVGTGWNNNPTTATPIDDIIAAREVVKGQIGVLPNTMVMSGYTFRLLTLNDQVVDRIKYSGQDDPKKVTVNMLAALFQVEKLLVGDPVRNTAAKGQAAAVSEIWSPDQIWLGVTDESRDLRVPRVGLSFHFTGDGSSAGGTVEQYRDEARRSDVMRVRIDVDEKIIYPEAGYILTGVDA